MKYLVREPCKNGDWSLPARGVWVEIIWLLRMVPAPKSLPARGVWVEIIVSSPPQGRPPGHSPHGECGLKSELVPAAVEARRHSPHGECGLKSSKSPSLLNNFASLPARGVWVEISSPSPSLIGSLSLPARGVWVEIWHRPPCRRPSGSHSPHGECGLKFLFLSFGLGRVLGHSPHGECGLKLHDLRRGERRLRSLPARGVWVEIITARGSASKASVTPRTGSVG